MTTTETKRQALARRLIEHEIGRRVSSLVHTLASAYGSQRHGTDLAELMEEAFELSRPVEDYEEAAREAGWKTADLAPNMLVNERMVDEDTGQCESFEVPEGGDIWREVCLAHYIEPYEREVYDHWIVSRWLAKKLEAKGERVGSLADLKVWGRTTTGQSIALDRVIQEIALETYRDILPIITTED